MNPFKTSREIAAPVEDVFAAIRDPERLARWWGPAGFTNTFEVFEFKPGGRWVFVMHGPDGRDYPNESLFAEIEAPGQVVIDHVCEPKFRLTISLAPWAKGTIVSWTQAFETEEMARQVQSIVVPANEENLDRLTAEVLGSTKSR
jgi:uncharacterized protein YndB with AHSA1/START domain